MGVLSDLIIADSADAMEINRAGGAHSSRWPVLESKGIDTIKLGTLATILLGAADDGSYMGDTSSLLDQLSDEGPWVFLVPRELVTAIAKLSPSQNDAIARRWGETEEFQLEGWPIDEIQEYLAELVAHCQKTKQQEKDLLLWMSL